MGKESNSAAMAPPAKKPLRYAQMRAHVEARPDGSIYLKHEDPLGDYPQCLGDRLVHWAQKTPDAVFIAERSAGGGWREVTYAQMLASARAIGQALLQLDLGPERPVAILSGNSVDHALIAMACLYVGIPWCPVSPPYALVSKDFGKLRYVFEKLTPGLVFVDDGDAFAGALAACLPAGCRLAISRNPPQGRSAILLDDLLATAPTSAVDEAFAKINGDTIVKFLLTSGSTGFPKAVINTHRMWSSNLAMFGATLKAVHDEPPVFLDWLPWNHTFGGNHNFGVAMYFGGALYIDEGRPTPKGIAATVRNLQDIAPTAYFNVPKGFEALVPHLRENAAMRRNFYSRLQFTFFAGASLSQHVWDALDEMSLAETGGRTPMLTGLGATETAPSALFTWPGESRAGWLGLPVPGVELKLVPAGGRYEARVRGSNITPGYWRDPQLTAAAFDEEGFYKFGDAVRFLDPQDPQRGVLFDGRIAEDFKLATGTWVQVGPLRSGLIRACAPYVRDVVIAGLDRDSLAALVLLDEDACRSLCGDAPLAQMAAHPALRDALRKGMLRHGEAATGSSNFIGLALVLDTPPSLDRGEVTDKGSINQRAVLQCRAADVDAVYSGAHPGAIIIERNESA